MFFDVLLKWWHVICWVAAIVFVIMLALLISEYRYFKSQAETMLALQTEYKNNIMATKRLLQGSSLVQGSTAAGTADEKKKNESGENNFLILNRGLEHGKEIAASFCKKSGIRDVYARIPACEWVEYTDWVLNEKERESKQASKKRRVFRRRKTPANAELTAPAYHHARAVFQGKKIFSWPIEPSHFWLSSLFGPRKKPNGTWGFHYGLDMASIRGTPVHAAAPGIVIEARIDKGYGKTIVLSHNSQFQTRYAHLDKILVKQGQVVELGQLIGRVGKTGAVRGRYDGSHLHFEVSSFGKRLNPLYLLR